MRKVCIICKEQIKGILKFCDKCSKLPFSKRFEALSKVTTPPYRYKYKKKKNG